MNDMDTNPAPRATIITFPRKRGRPRNMHKGIDTGTPELVMKRLLGDTAETLDLCLERGFITRHQHWCGIHLRWLYTLRYGAPGIRAIDPTHIKGMEINVDDPQWRSEREKEYNEALQSLARSGHALLLMNICVYNERPNFLNSSAGPKRPSDMLAKLSAGLDVLSDLWGKKR